VALLSLVAGAAVSGRTRHPDDAVRTDRIPLRAIGALTLETGVSAFEEITTGQSIARPRGAA
jgi:hypothetical protein